MSNPDNNRGNPFIDVLDIMKPGQRQHAPELPVKEQKKPQSVPDKQQVAEQAAAEQGYSRSVSQPTPAKQSSPKKPKAKPTKPEMEQFTVRAKVSVIAEFRELINKQEPKWSLGYALERAVKALKKELEG